MQSIKQRSLCRSFGVSVKWALLAAVLCVSCTSSSDDGPAVQPESSSGDVWHVVAFRFKGDAETKARIPEVVNAFSALQASSVDPEDPEHRLIKSFHYGINNSTEQVSFGTKGDAADRSTEYTFVLTFGSVAERDFYVDEEPTHQAFKELVGPLLEGGAEGVFVTDFVSSDGAGETDLGSR